jgi:hypothetical protein
MTYNDYRVRLREFAKEFVGTSIMTQMANHERLDQHIRHHSIKWELRRAPEVHQSKHHRKAEYEDVVTSP